MQDMSLVVVCMLYIYGRRVYGNGKLLLMLNEGKNEKGMMSTVTGLDGSNVT